MVRTFTRITGVVVLCSLSALAAACAGAGPTQPSGPSTAAAVEPSTEAATAASIGAAPAATPVYSVHVRGAVTYFSPDNRYGFAVDAKVTIHEQATGKVIGSGTAGSKGKYEIVVTSNKQLYARAVYVYTSGAKTWTLTGTNCCLIPRSGQPVIEGVNIAVR